MKNSHVSIVINNNIQVMVLLHRVWKKNPVSVDFLGIYIANDNQYSPLVHGLIGTTFWRNIFFVSAFSQSFCLKEMVAACVFSYKMVFSQKKKVFSRYTIVFTQDFSCDIF